MYTSRLLKNNLEWFVKEVNLLLTKDNDLTVRNAVITVHRNNPKTLGHFTLHQLYGQWYNHSKPILNRLKNLERKKQEARTSHEAQRVLVDENREPMRIIFTGNPQNFSFELKDDKIVVSCESDGFVMSNV